jgi:hypothetical protein
VAASGWSGRSESPTGGAIDWSTVNSDRAETGLCWARLGRSGPGRSGHVSSLGAATSSDWIQNGLKSTRFGVWWSCRCGSRVVCVVHDGLGPSSPFSSWCTVHRVHPATPGSPPLSLASRPRSHRQRAVILALWRLTGNTLQLYGFARAQGTQRGRGSGGLGPLMGSLMAAVTRLRRQAAARWPQYVWGQFYPYSFD